MLGKLILWGDLQKVLIAASEKGLSEVCSGAGAVEGPGAQAGENTRFWKLWEAKCSPGSAGRDLAPSGSAWD